MSWRMREVLSAALVTAGAAMVGYAGYGWGIGRAGGNAAEWQVAGLLIVGVALLVAGAFGARQTSQFPNSFPSDLRAIESLWPMLRRHSDGADLLEELVAVLCELHGTPGSKPLVAASEPHGGRADV